jgi:hypothetical protein
LTFTDGGDGLSFDLCHIFRTELLLPVGDEIRQEYAVMREEEIDSVDERVKEGD